MVAAKVRHDPGPQRNTLANIERKAIFAVEEIDLASLESHPELKHPGVRPGSVFQQCGCRFLHLPEAQFAPRHLQVACNQFHIPHRPIQRDEG